MTVLKQYNPSTSQWETIVVGKQGPAGFVSQSTAPDNINLLWLDTTGTSSTQAISPTIIDTKGDLIVGTANDTVTILPASTNGSVLTTDSGQVTGLVYITRSSLAADSAFTSAYAPKTTTVGTSLGTTGTIDLDMSSLNGTYQTISLTGNPTFTTSNRAAGRWVTIKLVAGGSSRTLAFPSWIFVGSAAPTTLASGKTAIITVTMFDTTDAAAVAAYAVQP